MPMLAARPTPAPPEKLTQTLSTTVSPTTKNRVRQLANHQGISMAEWQRRAIAAHLAR